MGLINSAYLRKVYGLTGGICDLMPLTQLFLRFTQDHTKPISRGCDSLVAGPQSFTSGSDQSLVAGPQSFTSGSDQSHNVIHLSNAHVELVASLISMSYTHICVPPFFEFM